MNLNNALRWLLTAAIFVAALLIGLALWQRYMESPWTRDGRVRADVISLAADVSGLVVALPVRDNQFVRQGDLLMQIDPQRYQLALAEAEAALSAREDELKLKQREAQRRAALGHEAVSGEEKESAASVASSSESLYRQALAARDLARLNLARTDIRAPIDGYVTNLDVHQGDYASAGRPLLALVDSHSFYVVGYFEETKLQRIRVGNPVRIRLMSGGAELRGHVESLSRGINDRNTTAGRELLADVNPTFNWVRLAQRIPVRIHLDEVPDSVRLVSGMTCTVIVEPAQKPADSNSGSGGH
ncbi:MAG: efflux RND transporter periplasmic adaptor subunit [Stenotrophobium sp.]